MARFRCDVRRKAIDDPRLVVEHCRREILQGNRDANPLCFHLADVAMEDRGARNVSGMNQHRIAGLQVGRVLVELKRESSGIRDRTGIDETAKVLLSTFYPAVV